MASRYHIVLTDELGETVKQIEHYNSVSYARALNDIGKLAIELPANFYSSPETLFTPDRRFEVYRRFPGRAASLDMQTPWFIRRVTYSLNDESEDVIQIEAWDALSILERRIIPYNSWSEEGQAAKATFADDMMKAIVRENFGTLASDTNRDLSTYLGVDADAGAAPSMAKEFARANVLDTLKEIAATSFDLGTFLVFDVTYNPQAKTFQFRTYTGQRGVDRTYPNGTRPLLLQPEQLTNVTFTLDYTIAKNYIYAYGICIGDICAPATAQDNGSINISPFNRLEFYVDADNDVDDADELQDEADRSLKENRHKEIFTARLLDQAGSFYGVDYNYGDKVTAQTKEGNLYDCHIDAVSITLDGEGEDVQTLLRSES